MDQSYTFELARQESLRTHRANPQGTFSQQRHRVYTIQNSGSFPIKDIQYTNKCCAISICDGLRTLGWKELIITDLITLPLCPWTIVLLMGFETTHEMFDSNRPEHQAMIYRLLYLCPYLRLEFFFGHQGRDEWFTTQEPCAIFGNGPNVVRILNKDGIHFECIISSEQPFLSPIKDVKQDEVIVKQEIIATTIRQMVEDAHLARQLADEEQQSTFVASADNEPLLNPVDHSNTQSLMDINLHMANAQLSPPPIISSFNPNVVTAIAPIPVYPPVPEHNPKSVLSGDNNQFQIHGTVFHTVTNPSSNDDIMLTNNTIPPEQKKEEPEPEPKLADGEVARRLHKQFQKEFNQIDADEEYAKRVHRGEDDDL